MPELETITIEGFKSIRSIKKLKLAPINVVVGPNGRPARESPGKALASGFFLPLPSLALFNGGEIVYNVLT